jgi:RNA:NAD 2'-phosphotransferase (TPT1/KptA family)
METKINLRHPAGRKAISMDKKKYEPLKKLLLDHLQSAGPATHMEILESINKNFKRDKIRFDGAVNWHLEWVKLDLEAAKKIKRVQDKSTVRYALC